MPLDTVDFEIIIGTYEEFLVGYFCSLASSSLKHSIASHDHNKSIRCVAYSGQYLASGSADDRIIVYDLKERKECNMLTCHDSTVNCVQFTKDQSYLISGSADGSLALTKVGTWQLEKKWDKAHKGLPIYDVAVHNSGKIALTLGGDYTLRTWNLIKGRQAYAINLNSKSKEPRAIERILWCSDENHFLTYGGHHTEIWNINDGVLVKSIQHENKVTSSAWLSQTEFISGFEDGTISIIDITGKKKLSKKIDDNRIKAVEFYNNNIISVSSSGKLKILTMNLDNFISENIGCRPTCLTVISGLEIKQEEKIQNEEIEIVETSSLKRKSHVVVEEEEDSNNINKPVQAKKKKHKKKLSNNT